MNRAIPTGRAATPDGAEPVPVSGKAGIPIAGIAGKIVCATCAHVRTFKPRKDEQVRYGFGDVGWECRKPGWEGYTAAFSGCSFHTPAQAMSAGTAETGTGSGLQPASAVRQDAPENPVHPGGGVR